MKGYWLLLPLFISLGTMNACSQSTASQALEGTWKMESCAYGGTEHKETTESEKIERFCLKIFSPGHFAVVEMFEDNPDSLFFAAIGRYQLTADKYSEKYDASNVGYQNETWREFDYSLDGDSLTITQSSDDMNLHEVWVRVEQ